MPIDRGVPVTYHRNRTLCTIACIWLTAEAAAAAPATAPVPSAVVETHSGAVQGLVVDGVAAFKGIPYGAPPIAARRFLPPQAAAPWPNVLVAADFGAPALQLYDRPHTGSALSLQLATVFTTRSDEKIDNEDCLFLNVWTPASDTGKRPVMVWLHGGGFAYGSGAWPLYDGANLARAGDVVVVTVNHRLNVFGYLQLAERAGAEYARSGNAGMLDLVLALEWVRDNIAAFGGDASNVTIMGESGGGAKVSTLLAMPAAKGLFHRAVIQSGPGLTGVSREAAQKTTAAILAELGLADADAATLRAALSSLPADVILSATRSAQAKAGPGFGAFPLAPVVDGGVLPRDPFTPAAPELSKYVPILIGWNKDEMTLFNNTAPWWGKLGDEELRSLVRRTAGDGADALIAAYRKLHPDYTPTYLYNAIAGDSFMMLGSLQLAERKAAQGGAPAYVYMLAWETPVGNGIFKTPHTLEIPFVFRNVDRALALTGESAAARSLEQQMSSAWIAFARRGDPNTDSLPAWPAYDAERRATMLFDVAPRVESDPKGEARRLLSGEKR
jgi:para-nitrobenzyl esterase